MSIVCPVCGSVKIVPTDFSVTVWDGKEFTVSYCTDCYLYFLPKQPSVEDIEKHYKLTYYSYSKPVLIIKLFFRKLRALNQYDFIASRINLKEGRVLEIGAAEGYLLKQFKNAGNNIVGTEYSDFMRAVALNKLHIQLMNTDFFAFDEKVKYDLILMSHVFEHFQELSPVVEKVKRLLKPGGYFFIEVPNSPKKEDVELTVLRDYLNTEHFYNFNAGNLRTVVEKFRFLVVDVKRFDYSHIHWRGDAGFAVKRCLLTGQIRGISDFFGFLGFVVFSFFDKKNAYEEVPIESDWNGFGDSVRLLCRYFP